MNTGKSEIDGAVRARENGYFGARLLSRDQINSSGPPGHRVRLRVRVVCLVPVIGDSAVRTTNYT